MLGLGVNMIDRWIYSLSDRNVFRALTQKKWMKLQTAQNTTIQMATQTLNWMQRNTIRGKFLI